MYNMSILDEVLLEELNRSKKIKAAIEREQENLPKGSLQLKIIHGSECYYLQYRDGSKILSKYISKNDVEETQKKIKIRNENKIKIKQLDETIKKLQKALGKELLNDITNSIIKDNYLEK